MEINSEFILTIFVHKLAYRIKVKRIYQDKTTEKFEVIGKKKKIILTGNGPLLRSKGLKHWRPTWTVEGHIWNKSAFDVFVDALDKKLKGM